MWGSNKIYLFSQMHSASQRWKADFQPIYYLLKSDKIKYLSMPPQSFREN